ncbi:MAG: hypothetical protein HYT85_04830 [candidate division NC10 bacterium]|nr:hypothetical protein [candidate division NC10 bacterium]
MMSLRAQERLEVGDGGGRPDTKAPAVAGLRAIDVGLPLAQLHDLSKVESYNKNLYRPSSYLHKWWARRLGSVFRTIILGTFCPPGEDLWRRYYEGARFPDRIVLDPFMGGGTTIHEALRLGCKVIGVDYNPVAWWAVRSSISLPDLDRLEEGFLTLKEKVSTSLLSYHITQCPRCAERAYAAFVLWVRKAKCERCSSLVRLHESFVLRIEGEVKTVLCPHCGDVLQTKARDAAKCSGCGHRVDLKKGVADNGQYTCPECSHVQRVPRGTTTPAAPDQYEMFAVRYVCPTHGEGFKKADSGDLQTYRAARDQFLKMESFLPIPDQAIPDGWKTGDLLAHDYVKWRDLFNPRQLLCAGTLLKEILQLRDGAVREAFVTLLSACLEFNNALCTYKGGNVRRPGAVRVPAPAAHTRCRRRGAKAELFRLRPFRRRPGAEVGSRRLREGRAGGRRAVPRNSASSRGNGRSARDERFAPSRCPMRPLRGGWSGTLPNWRTDRRTRYFSAEAARRFRFRTSR